MLLKILYKTIVVFIKFHGLQAAIVICFKSACWIITKLHINESKTYTQITMHLHSVDLIRHPKKPLKTPTLRPYDLILLFCMTIKELWTWAALKLGYSRKNQIGGGRGWGLRTGNFQGYWRNSKWIFWVLIIKKMEFSGNFVEVLRVKPCFVWNFQR